MIVVNYGALLICGTVLAGLTGMKLNHVEWAVARHYEGACPRYTSYPTVPFWQEASSEVAVGALRRAGGKVSPVSIYVHIPFCARMCSYCGCNVVVTRSAEKMSRYVEALCDEFTLSRRFLGHRPSAQVHWGGGTPTSLSPEEMLILGETLFDAFPPTPDAEMSLEIDPTVTGREHLLVARRLGFWRLSIGVQDFDPEVQRMIGRHQDPKVTRTTVNTARELGFRSINLDLLYGLPGQTSAGLRKSALEAAGLDADRVALFGYAHVPALRPHQRRLERFDLPNAQQRWEMLGEARATLLEQGYQEIGLDHFARPNDALAQAQRRGELRRNFQGYTVLGDLPVLGFGMSAISDVGGVYLQNSKRMSEYITAMDLGTLATVRSFVRGFDDEIRWAAIQSVMCELRVSFPQLSRRFDVDAYRYFDSVFDQLPVFVEDGLVVHTKDGFAVSDKGRPFLRQIAGVFDGYRARDSVVTYAQAL